MSLDELHSQAWRERAAGNLETFLRAHDVPQRIADVVVGLVRYASAERLGHVRFAVSTAGEDWAAGLRQRSRTVPGAPVVAVGLGEHAGLAVDSSNGCSLLDLLRLRTAAERSDPLAV